MIGGLGGALSEWLSTNTSNPLEMVGVRDNFGQSGGSSELMELMGLNEVGICEAARRAISRK